MSRVSLHEVTCPKCGKTQRIERYDSINNYHNELFPKIVDKTIFDYQCECCKKIVHEPYPLLFHLMGFQDVQIAYKFPEQAFSFARAFLPPSETENELRAMGVLKDNIMETYDDEDEFAYRVAFVLLKRRHPLIDKETFDKMSKDEQKEYMEKVLSALRPLTLGASGTGKTARFILPNIKETGVITDK